MIEIFLNHAVDKNRLSAGFPTVITRAVTRRPDWDYDQEPDRLQRECPALDPDRLAVSVRRQVAAPASVLYA